MKKKRICAEKAPCLHCLHKWCLRAREVLVADKHARLWEDVVTLAAMFKSGAIGEEEYYTERRKLEAMEPTLANELDTIRTLLRVV